MAENNSETTVIAADTQIRGEMTFDRAARILGQFEGKINAKGQLQVADTAVCRAEINAGDVVVDGAIEGNLTAGTRVQINAKARVKGDIVAERLVTAEGASIFGHVAVGQEAKTPRGQAALPPPQQATGARPQEASRPEPQPARKG